MAVTDWIQFISYESNVQLPRDQYQIFDNYIFMCICVELYRLFCRHEHDDTDVFNHQLYKVEDMSERNFMGAIIKDLLHSGDYTIDGIAYYTQTQGDIIYEIMIGLNPNPSISLSKKIISLHKEARPALYRQIIKQCLAQHMEEVSS